MFDDSTLVRRRPDAITADVGEESVVLDSDSGTFFQLNGSGARIWALLEEPRTVGALCDALVARHAVSPERCRADVAAFLAAIAARGLIVSGG